MTELYINNQLCELPTDFKITLITENLYFSSASTFTLDVKLTMAPMSNNSKIFGNLNRFDKRLSQVSLPARLIVDNRTILNGTAVIVGVTNDSVSVQLLQGRSEQNWKSKYEKTYIDELWLGSVGAWNMTIEIVTTSTGQIERAYPNTNLAKVDPNSGSPIYYWEQADFANANNGNVVITPIINHATGEIMNNCKPYRRTWSSVYWRSWFYVGRYTTRSGIEGDIRYAPQPKLSYMVNKIFDTLGLRITYNELEQTDYYNKLFIANSSAIIYQADLLPHWTFTEFVEQLQLIFNCIIIIEENNTRIYLRKNIYNLQSGTGNTAAIHNAVDEFEADIETETAVSDADKPKVFDISYPDYGTMFLGDDFKDVPIVGPDELSSIRNPHVFSRNAKNVKVSSPYKDNGNVYGYEIDQYEASPSEVTDEKATLKFIPLMPDTETEAQRFFYYLTNGGSIDDGHWGEYQLTIPESEGVDIENESTNIQTYLDELDTPPEKNTLDKLSLGFLTKRWLEVPQGGGTFVLTHYDVMTVLYQSAKTANYEVDNIPEQPYGMSLYPRLMNNGNLMKNLYNTFYKNTPSVVVSNPTVIKFVSDSMHNPLDKFLIRNQLYACKQIKYTVTAKGFDKIAEGTFYKL